MDRNEVAAAVIREFGICGRAVAALMVAFPESEDEGLVDIVVEAAMQTRRSSKCSLADRQRGCESIVV